MVDTGLCKIVRIRFEHFLRLLKPSDVATAIIAAQRKGTDELTVPRKNLRILNHLKSLYFNFSTGYLYYLNAVLRVFPLKATNLVRDFFDSGVESDI